jgi:serine/threonine protein kinase/formylglycine-generating enzyme required for sulfatase activity
MPNSPSDSEDRLFLWLDRFRLAHPGGDPALIATWAAEQPELIGEDSFVRRLKSVASDQVHVEKLLGLVGSEGEKASISFFGRHDHSEKKTSVASPLQSGQRIGRFVLTEFISKGGMGQVWIAEDSDLKRDVALKFVLPERLRERHLDQFLREARAGGRLHHRNLVATLAYGTDDGLPWIAQELIEGSWTLKDFLEEALKMEGLPKDYYRDVARLVAEVADGLQVAHEGGVIHRDVKPANILITSEDVPKITDFGLARVSGDSFLSVTGEFAGTWAYMSPEQVAAKRMGLDHRTDIFSLGVVLYELLALRRPFDGDTTAQIAEKIMHADPPEASSVRSQCPRELALICGKAIEKLPAARYQTMADLAADLRRHLADEPIIAKPPNLVQRCAKWARRNPSKSVGAAVTSIALVVVSLLALKLADALGDSRANEVLASNSAKVAEQHADDVEAEREKTQLALETATEQRLLAEAERADVLRLSAQQDLDDLMAEVGSLWPPHPENLPALRVWIARAEMLVEDLPLHEAKRAELRALALAASHESTLEQASDQTEWVFPEGQENARWWNARLSQLIGGLELLRDELLPSEKVSVLDRRTSTEGRLPFGWSIGKRLAFAEQLEDGFAPGGEYDAAWQRDLPAIRASDPSLSELTPQQGLVPIGVDPQSGLWEFADLATGSPATRGNGGKLIRTDETGLVLVLIPGGTFWMGAQSTAPQGRHFDSQANAYEAPVHEVDLSPYFLSKYEMTQAQWTRVAGGNPSRWYAPEVYSTTWNRSGRPGSMLHPVEQVSWIACNEFCERFGLQLPSEAQWENACRAQTSSVYWCGDTIDSLPEVANISDQWAKDNDGENWKSHDPIDDGNTIHAATGSYRANPFGLHDIHGNVWEWCIDIYDETAYGEGREKDPVGTPTATAYRVMRGGAFNAAAFASRSAQRSGMGPSTISYSLGLRPARKVHP